MKIYLKATVYAAKNIPDFSTEEERAKEIEDFTNQLENDIFDLGTEGDGYDAGYADLSVITENDVPDYVPIKD